MISIDSELAQDRELARRLSRTWDPFFSRFGRLTNVQRAAIPPILDRKSVLVCAPTAAGKTEAACAPLVEARVGRTDPWTILYISPTRALVNDLYERLARPLERLQLRVARRTGDHRDPVANIPHVLITTPESFDSLLCRGRRSNGHVLAHVDAVVLDEIHLLHASARGEQVRWLLERLQRLRSYACETGWTRSESVQVVALSATVPAPEAVRDAYLPGGELLELAGGRSIEAVAVECESPTVECALPAYVAQLKEPEKILVFSNQRLRVDKLADIMRKPLEAMGYSIAAHHGSLAQKEREATEQAVKKMDRIVVFATSTLEIGIDVGDINLVVLDGPAPDVPALLQRIGRGNRRTDRTRVMLCAGSMAEVLVQSAMLTAARDSYLGYVERGPSYAVARQQVASYIFQGSSPYRRRDTLDDLVKTSLSDVQGAALLDHLTSTNELTVDARGVRLGELWLDATTRGEIHSNIESRSGNAVHDDSTGDQIAVGVRYSGAPRIAIAGNLLKVKEWRERRIDVRRATDGQPTVGGWSYTTSAWVQGAGQPQAVRRYLGFEENEWPVLLDGCSAVVFHFGGGRRKALLKLLAARAPDPRAISVDNWTIRFRASNGTRPAWLTDVGPATVDLMIAGQLDQLEKALARPAANKALPLELRLAEVRAWLDVERQLTIVQAATWSISDDPDVLDDLRLLQSGLKD